MNKTFLNLEESKRKRILQASYEEFTEHSYQNASTNHIVKKAGISKGTLFNYFGSKEELYYYLIDHGLHFIRKHYAEDVEHSTTDFIERCKLIAELEIKAYAEAPYIMEFFAKLYVNSEGIALPAEIEEKRNHILQAIYLNLYDNIDDSLFRKDLPPEQVIQMIRWIFEGYEKEMFTKINEEEMSFDKLLSFVGEFENFLEMLKKIFYK